MGSYIKSYSSGKSSIRNGVGVILNIEVIRESDKVIVMRIILEDKVLNVVSTYTLQVGYKEGQQKDFWQKICEMMVK